MYENIKRVIRAFFWFILVVSFVLYIKYYDSWKGVLTIVRNFAPSLIFIFGAILIADKYYEIINRRRMQQEVEETITVTYYDAMKNDLLAFLTAAAILLIPGLFSSRGIDFIDIIQAIIAFTAIYYVRVYYFNKIGK